MVQWAMSSFAVPETAPTTRVPRADVDPERQRLACAYRRTGRLLYLLSMPLTPLLLIVLFVSGFSTTRAASLRGALGREWLVIALGASVVGGILFVVGLPLHVVRGYVLPKRYGLLRQTCRDWSLDLLKGLVLGGLFGLGAIEGLYWLIRTAGSVWWLYAGIALFLLSLLVGAVAPIVIAPLFFKFTPLPEGEVLDRMRHLARRGGVRVRGIYRFDMSTKWAGANAAVFGFGPTRRIIVADSMLDDYPPEGVEAVVAHELGHHVHGDMWIMTVVSGLTSLFGFAVVAQVFEHGWFGLAPTDVQSVASLPAFLLIYGVVTDLFGPLALALSRHAERRADAYAGTLSGHPEWLRDALIRLADENLAELDPPRWEVLLRFSHPPVRERLATRARDQLAASPASRP